MIRLLSSLRAEALQSILQLMGEKEMYEYWSQTYRVHNLEWSQEKAADILHAWQRKFTQVGVIWAYAATALALAAVPFDLVASLRIYIIFFFPFAACISLLAAILTLIALLQIKSQKLDMVWKWKKGKIHLFR